VEDDLDAPDFNSAHQPDIWIRKAKQRKISPAEPTSLTRQFLATEEMARTLTKVGFTAEASVELCDRMLVELASLNWRGSCNLGASELAR
jgi:hypothetical protein